MKHSTRHRVLCALLSALLLPAAMPSFAQSDKLTRFILPVAAGSGVDTIMRASSGANDATCPGLVIDDDRRAERGREPRW